MSDHDREMLDGEPELAVVEMLALGKTVRDLPDIIIRGAHDTTDDGELAGDLIAERQA